MYFVMKRTWFILPIYQIKNLETVRRIYWIITDENKSHYVCIKDFNRFMCNNTKNNTKKHFCKYCLQCFSSEKVLIEHQENCLKNKW